ncbi:phage portal protein [Brevibacillus dissolubilis]|uniref:phage portal protein n=1 Tax=Brevibacillus dissolubilis TaxID=1844116 RepID=UPI0021006709|nr:phage portal protein [Brevibacillus dissolubilis]
MKKVNVRVIKAQQKQEMTKAQHFAATEEDPYAGAYTDSDLLAPPYLPEALYSIYDNSTILKQCVETYRRNIVGFGAALKYVEDETQSEETPEMRAEWDFFKNFMKYFNFDQSFEDVMGEAIEHREIYGNAYIEILRNGRGLPDGGEIIDPKFVRLTKLGEPVDITYMREGKIFYRKKRFRKYAQKIGGKTVWFKEFGDPRKMDSRTGQYTQQLPIEHEANEILHLKIGSSAYGVPRWVGHSIHMVGARKAEELNYRYFEQGRHTPAAIIISNGTLSEQSEEALAAYAASVEGTDNAHKFLLIEAEGMVDDFGDKEGKNVKIELKSLADMLQQDALFLEYDEASRKKVQSSFRLPDIFVGRSTDYNRATADTARKLTEDQVFKPERNSLEFIINNKLLAEYQLKSTVLYFRGPDISDSEEKARLLDVFIRAGAVAPNDLREEVGKVIGKELENFADGKFNLPAGVQGGEDDQGSSVPVQKADDDIVAVLKDVRDVLEEVAVVEKINQAARRY